jgi:major membrane immunogen (membrane-anchored lipoprotein)
MLSLKLTATTNRFASRFLALLVGPALLVMASCGADDGLGQRYPVSGTVTYNGKPLERGSISFVAEDAKSNIGASGTIKDGAYTLSTGGNDDGAQAGKYKVTVTSKEDFLSKATAGFQKGSGPGIGSKVPPQNVAKAEAEVKSLIPVGYGDPRSTTLTAEVKPQTNSIDFKLTDAEAPPAAPKATTNKVDSRR